ncbi:MAG: thiamine pyrophosphate-binding protein [Bacillota bacterium]|nr:thiamine pyrophosphate-binding protein [Bacillota bacterium]
MTLSGAAYVVKFLREQGVEVVFGYPGGSILEIFDAMAADGIRFVLTRHEQGAVFAADGYARATGKVGVCMATSGPGATNLITGLACAHMDSVPIVAITGQVYSHLLGTDAFQEADTFGITMPVTKHNFLVRGAGELPSVLRQAFHIAGTGRRGPVLVDIPRDAAQGVVRSEKADLDLPGYRPTEEGHPLQLRRAAEALVGAHKPVIWAGGGVVAAGAAAELRALAEALGAPVMTSLMGLGVMPADHPLNLGMVGMHGTPWANWAVHRCDLLFAAGVRFDDRATGKLERFAPDAQLVHIDIDPAEIGKLLKAVVPVVADLGTALPAVRALVVQILNGNQRLIGRSGTGPAADAGTTAGAEPGAASEAAAAADHSRKEWLASIAAFRAGSRWPPITHAGPGMHPGEVMLALARASEGKATLVADVGQNQMWAAQLYPVHAPRRFLTSGGLGTMGYALPAAIGAQMGTPDEQIIVIAGDGGLQMTSPELATIAEHRLPIKIFLINNGHLGMVRQWQELFFKERYMAVKIAGPDFVKLAGAYGLTGMRVDSVKDLDATIASALSTPGPVLVDCVVQPTANVFPIVPPGKGVDQMIDKAE